MSQSTKKLCLLFVSIALLAGCAKKNETQDVSTTKDTTKVDASTASVEEQSLEIEEQVAEEVTANPDIAVSETATVDAVVSDTTVSDVSNSDIKASDDNAPKTEVSDAKPAKAEEPKTEAVVATEEPKPEFHPESNTTAAEVGAEPVVLDSVDSAKEGDAKIPASEQY